MSRYVPIREALSPQQREMKRDHLLSAQRSDDSIPSLLEVLKYHDESEYDSPSHLTSVWIETMDEKVPGWEKMSIDDRIVASAPYRDEILQRARVEAAEKYGESYRAAVELLDALPPRAYRAIILPDTIAPERHDGLGQHWSLQKKLALPYDATRRGRIVVYEIELDPRVVNRSATVLARTDPEYGAYEDEVVLYRHAPVLVTRILERSGRNAHMPGIIVDEIDLDEWRRA